MGFLDGKVALITGAARGQGRAHAVTSAREGANVILIDIAEQMNTVPYAMATGADMAETVLEVERSGRRALSITADVRSQGELDDAVSRGITEFGQIDILIANAGIWTTAPFWELSEETWDEMIGVNLTGVWKSAKAVARHMIERQTGSIVITSSINGLEPGLNYAHYVSAKHGVIGLMKNIALEMAPYGVRCNAICPGAVLTPMTNHQDSWDLISGHNGGTEAEMIDFGYHFGALKQRSFLAPQVIADTALYLNSELAAAVTGVTIPVDAGHTLLAGFNHSPAK
jgi:SDR family mycofactocin-dependent oxidoreductase